MSEEFYSAKDAIEKLGLAPASFHRKVASGQIPKVTPSGRKKGVYPKRDIDALALALNIVFETPEKFDFSRSTPGDQVEEMNIGILCFGQEYITPLRERIAFQEKSEYTFWSLKVSGQVVGYISVFRFPPAFLNDILTGRHIERDISVREVLRFKREEPFNVYIDVMAVDPRLTLHQQKFYSNMIAVRFSNILLDLLNNRYQIQALYTVTATPEGDNLARKFGFKLLEGKSLAPGRLAYVFPLDAHGIELLKKKAQASRKVKL
jgi:hypothetical protein